MLRLKCVGVMNGRLWMWAGVGYGDHPTWDKEEERDEEAVKR